MAKSMNKILKQAQKMQAKMMQAQDELQKKEIQGTAGGGMVTITINGAYEVVSVAINKEVIDPDDNEMLEDLVLAACNNAVSQVKELSEQTLGGIGGNLSFPG